MVFNRAEFAKMKTIKSVDLITLEWFDKLNGNNYFCRRIVVNYGMANQAVFTEPVQLGHGSVNDFKYTDILKKHYTGLPDVMWRLKGYGVILRFSKRVALESELKQLINK